MVVRELRAKGVQPPPQFRNEDLVPLLQPAPRADPYCARRRGDWSSSACSLDLELDNAPRAANGAK